MTRRRTFLLVLAWMGAIVLAGFLDTPVARHMHDSGFDAALKSRKALCVVLKTPGEFWFAAAMAVVALFARGRDWKSAIFVILATAMSGMNGLVKWIAGRTRPYKLFNDVSGEAYLAPFQLDPLRGGVAGLFQSKNLSFPSGHACMAFAVAESLAILWPRGRWVFYVGASITAVERFAENAHYVSDCVAGAALAIAGVHLIHWLWFRVVLPRFGAAEGNQHDLEVKVPAGK